MIAKVFLPPGGESIIAGFVVRDGFTVCHSHLT